MSANFLALDLRNLLIAYRLFFFSRQRLVTLKGKRTGTLALNVTRNGRDTWSDWNG